MSPPVLHETAAFITKDAGGDRATAPTELSAVLDVAQNIWMKWGGKV